MNGGADPREDLLAAIERLYDVFGCYELRPRFEDRCSPFCSEEHVADLLSAPLRALGAEGLSIYAFKALSTMGDEVDFKHFLPRMLELYALSSDWLPASDTVLFEKARAAGWAEWPAAERQAVEDFLRVLWRALLHDVPVAPSVSEVLRGLGALAVDPAPYLAEWHLDSSAPAVRRLAQFVNEHVYDMESLGDARRALEDWLTSKTVRDVLEHAFYRYEAEPFASELGAAADGVQGLALLRAHG
jgi:hypothetical protein